MDENVLETEVDTAEETVEETFEEIEDTTDDGDDEFEYDENGDIIVPDVELDTEDEEEDTDSEEENSDEETEDEGEGETAPEEPKEEPKTEEAPAEEPAKPDPRDVELQALRKRVKELESQGKDTLKKLGKENVDLDEGLAELAAEAEGISVAEYKEKRQKEANEQAAKDILRSQLFEVKAASDLKELHAAYPETQKYTHVRQLPDGIRQKFGKYRDLGLPAKEAYAAANPDGIRTDTATAVKKQAQHASKEHLKSSVPKPSKSNDVSMSKAELAYWKELFPDKSTAEIQKIYKETL